MRAVITRRGFLGGTLAVGALAAARPLLAAASEIEEATIASLQAGIASGKFTVRKLAELYLERIAAVDKGIRSVLYTNPDALQQADALDVEWKSGRRRRPLHGIPILLKGNIDTADRLATTAGSLALAGRIAKQDAFVVARLRGAGCLILGKTNLSEWANIRSNRSSSGWSGEGGQVRNPYALDRSPSGSSSGSASAAAASLCAAAVGTETDGSIVSPSSCQALVGIKPTVGLLSRAGIIPIAHTQDTPGPMARTVADAAALLGAMTGADAQDPATAHSKPEADYLTFLDATGLKGARIGVLRRDDFGLSPATQAVGEDALRAIVDAGATLIDPVDIGKDGNPGNAELDVLLYELKADLNTYLANAGGSVRTLADVIAFNEAHAKEEMPYFGQELFLQAQKKGPLTDPGYRRARAACQKLGRALDAAFAKHKLDAMFAPTGGPAWLIDHVNGDTFTGGSSTITAVPGYPAITVPAGQVHGLPVGVSFMGLPWSEGKLIRFAFAFEQATKARRAPTFRPTVELP